MVKSKQKPTASNPDKTTQVNFRLTPELIARLDAHAERMRVKHPGLRATRVDALRILLLDALERVENEDAT